MSKEQSTSQNSCKSNFHALGKSSKLDKPKVPTLVINKRPPRKPKVPVSEKFNEIVEQKNFCNNSTVESNSSNAVDSISESAILQLGIINDTVLKIANLDLDKKVETVNIYFLI